MTKRRAGKQTTAGQHTPRYSVKLHSSLLQASVLLYKHQWKGIQNTRAKPRLLSLKVSPKTCITKWKISHSVEFKASLLIALWILRLKEPVKGIRYGYKATKGIGKHRSQKKQRVALWLFHKIYRKLGVLSQTTV